jgi:hypothetical protein
MGRRLVSAEPAVHALWRIAWLMPAFLPAQDLSAEERHALSFDLGATPARQIRQFRIAVQDVPKHELRLYERQRDFAHRTFSIGAIEVEAMREWGTADLVDENGTETACVAFRLADGNRVFGRYRGTVATRRWPDGSRHYDVRGSLELTGGTLRFEAIRGTILIWQALDPGADSSQGRAQGEYWFDRRGHASGRGCPGEPEGSIQ